MTVKPEIIFGRSLGITFTAITWNQECKIYVPSEESLPRPLGNIDVVRRTNTTMDVFPESVIDDYCNSDVGRDLWEPLTGFKVHNIK